MPNTYYVSQDSGDDSHNATQAQDPATPWATLSHAFYVAGDTSSGVTYGNAIIINDSATYNVRNGTAGTDHTTNQIEATSGYLPREFEIKAGTGCTPILDGAFSADFAISCWKDWVIEGITFRKFGSSVAHHFAIKETTSRGSDASQVRNCTIHSISGTAISLTDTGVVVEGCLIYDILNLGINGFNRFTVQNNIIYDCHSVAINGGRGTDSSNTVVQHNTIHNSPARGSINGTRTYAIFTTNANYNIITEASCTISALNASGDHSYNCVSGTYDHLGIHVPKNFHNNDEGTGDLSGSNPDFNDKDGNDFTLRQTSPCIGAANGSSLMHDFVTGSRGWNYNHKVLGVNAAATHDMGALEETHTKVKSVDTELIGKVLGVT